MDRSKTGILPLPEKGFMEMMHLYQCRNMYVTRTKTKFEIFHAETHSHDGYEVVIPLDKMDDTLLGDTKITFEVGYAYIISPWLCHGTSENTKFIHIIDLMIDKVYFENTYKSIYENCKIEQKIFILKMTQEMNNLIKAFIKESKQEKPGSNLVLDSICCQFVVELLREMHSAEDMAVHKEECAHYRKLEDIINFLNECYHRDCSIEMLSEMANMSRYHFIRLFKKVIGKTPYDYLLDIRIDKAKEFFRDKNAKITEVSIRCGFNNISHFSNVFKKKVGYTPTEFKKNIFL